MFKNTNKNKILTTILMVPLVLGMSFSTFFIQPQEARAISFGDIADSITKGLIVLDFCTDEGEGGVVTQAIGGAIDRALGEVSNLLKQGSVGEKLKTIAEFAENIPGVGGIIGGLVSGFLGGGEEPVADERTRAHTRAINRKEQCLDALQQQARDIVLAQFSDKTVAWIQAGLSLGNPRFVVNLGAQLRRKADQAFNNFLGDTETFEFMCNSYKYGISRTLESNYYSRNPRASGLYSYRSPPIYGPSRTDCGLEVVLGGGRDAQRNIDLFLREDFTRGGWNAWFALLDDPGSNPYAAYLEQSRKLSETIDEGRTYELELIRQGRGFLPDLRCDAQGTLPDVWGRCPDGSEPDVVTPGSVVAGIAQKMIDSDVDRALYSDEVNEIVNDFTESLFGSVTAKGLLYANATGVGPDPMILALINRIIGSLLATLEIMEDLDGIARVNNAKSVMKIPPTNSSFDLDDVRDIWSRYGSEVGAIESCETVSDPGQEETSGMGETSQQVCTYDNIDLGRDSFPSGTIDLAQMIADARSCSDASVSRAQQDIVYPPDRNFTFSGTGPQVFDYGQILILMSSEIGNIEGMLEELRVMKEDIRNTTLEQVQEVDERHRALINRVPNDGDLFRGAVDMLEFLSYVSRFGRALNNSQCTPKLRPGITLSKSRDTNESNPYKTIVTWDRVDVGSTSGCTVSLIGSYDYEIQLKSSPNTTQKTGTSEGGNAQTDLNWAVSLTDSGSTAVRLVVFHDAKLTFTMTCDIPSTYGDYLDEIKSISLDIPSDGGSVFGTCKDTFDNNGDGLIDTDDPGCSPGGVYDPYLDEPTDIGGGDPPPPPPPPADNPDIDGDGVCTGDTAVEGVCSAGPDNCFSLPNSDQADLDSDGEGDVCDGDKDGDLLWEWLYQPFDNCPLVVNPRSDWTDINGIDHFNEQQDTDLDGVGNACDSTPGSPGGAE